MYKIYQRGCKSWDDNKQFDKCPKSRPMLSNKNYNLIKDNDNVMNREN